MDRVRALRSQLRPGTGERPTRPVPRATADAEPLATPLLEPLRQATRVESAVIARDPAGGYDSGVPGLRIDLTAV